MRLATVTISAALIGAGLTLASVPAIAEATGSLSGCAKMADQVKQALASNSQSTSYDQAVKEKDYGRDFCNYGLYARGESHYAEALKLLGAEKS